MLLLRNVRNVQSFYCSNVSTRLWPACVSVCVSLLSSASAESSGMDEDINILRLTHAETPPPQRSLLFLSSYGTEG